MEVSSPMRDKGTERVAKVISRDIKSLAASGGGCAASNDSQDVRCGSSGPADQDGF